MQTRKSFLETRRRYYREHSKKCSICKKKINAWTKTGRCSDCFHESRRGIVPKNMVIAGWNKGKKQSPEQIEKRMQKLRGRKYPYSPRPWRKGIWTGKKNPLYKHGQTGTPEYHAKMNKALRKKKLLELAGRPISNACEICGIEASKLKLGLYFDHDHATGRFRGWICHSCNVALGMIKDNPEIAKKIVTYLSTSTLGPAPKDYIEPRYCK